MKRFFFIIPLFFLTGVILAQRVTYTFTLTNDSKNKMVDYVAEISLSSLGGLDLNDYVATDGNTVVPVEISTDLKGNKTAIFPVAVINGLEEKKFTIRPGDAWEYPKRTYAEIVHKIGGRFEGNSYTGDYSWVKPNRIQLPGTFRDHAYYIKYEGPGWESDKTAFRFYLDQRNAVDVFGKKTPHIILPFVGIDGYESYHKMAGWGMDNMKVGNALGLGTIAIWNGKKAERVEKRDSVLSYVQADGKIRSQVKTIYYGWNANGTKCNLHSLISIDAGSRASHMELLADKSIDNICTGFNKDPNAEFLTGNRGRWTYIASFGKQSISNETMGLAVFFRTSRLKEITSDAQNHVVVLTPADGYVDYYFMPTWELEWDPVKTKEDFLRCIDEVLLRLNQPSW